MFDSFSSFSCRLILVIAAAGLICGCAGTAPTPAVEIKQPELPPIHVNGSEPISFAKVIIKMELGQEVGKVYSGPFKIPRATFTWNGQVLVGDMGYRTQANEELEDCGFNVVGGEPTLFNENADIKARFQLGGTILRADLNAYDKEAGNYAVGNVIVEWQLYDSFIKKVILDTETAGSWRQTGNSTGVVQRAFRNALHALIAMGTLPKLVATNNAPVAEMPTANSLSITPQSTKVALSLPEDMEKAMDGVVVIRAGQITASGAIVSPNGYILTAAHAVSGVNEVGVVLKNGLELTASVVRIDTIQDVALIKIPGEGHHALGLNFGDAAKIGSELYAIGAPAGEKLSSSVTHGVVSGYREIGGQKFIQTDASISPGNSGGPLLDKSGKVIGVVSWKIARPGFEGLSFGVAVDTLTKSLGIDWTQAP
jgi:S1-C subfamily serine protease